MHSLNDYFISAPASTLLTLISGLSMVIVFDYTGRIVFKSQEPIQRAMYFFAGLLALTWSSWIICLLGIASVLIFKIALWIILLSALLIVVTKRWRPPVLLNWKSLLSSNTRSIEFYFGLTIATLLVGYLLLSLSVPTDADSLSYHLALPVDILRTGDLWFNKDNLHFRMAGFGEMVNLFGVANGCPQLGSFIQVIGFLYFLVAATENVSRQQQSNLLILFLSVPTLLFLIPSQKHQFTGLLATSLCFLFLSKSSQFSLTNTVLWVLVLLFAAGIKYSFLISAFSLLVFFCLKYPDRTSLSRLSVIILLLTAIILGPQFLFKWFYFKDPVSPLLEKFLPFQDSVVAKLYGYIKNYSESAFTFPLGLFVTNNIGKISTVFGISAIVFCFVPFMYRTYKAETITVCLLFVTILAGGQISSRFFMEPLFWAIPLFVTVYKSDFWFRYFIAIARIQFLVVMPLVFTGVYFLTPSLFSDKMRDTVLSERANGYAESIWLDKVLPKDAVIATTIKSRAFLPRTYLPWEYLIFTSFDDQKQINLLDKKLITDYKVSYLVLPYRYSDEIKKRYGGKLVFGPKIFKSATRNPFNKTTYELAVYRVKTNIKF